MSELDQRIETALDRCSALQRSGFWVSEERLRLRAWLDNFTEEEKGVALKIFNELCFFSDRMVNALFKAAYMKFRRSLVSKSLGYNNAKARVNAILPQVYYTRVEGERPNPVDSGNLFCRKARQHLGIPESQIVTPAKAQQEASKGRTIVLLDDFAGSGNQLTATWKRTYWRKRPRSLKEAYAYSNFDCHYVCLVATEKSLRKTASLPISIHPAHTLDSSYSIERVGDDEDRKEIKALLKKYANRLHLKDYMRSYDFASYGFHSLGLTLAFEHSVPDASLPIIWAEGEKDWVPLIKRK